MKAKLWIPKEETLFSLGERSRKRSVGLVIEADDGDDDENKTKTLPLTNDAT